MEKIKLTVRSSVPRVIAGIQARKVCRTARLRARTVFRLSFIKKKRLTITDEDYEENETGFRFSKISSSCDLTVRRGGNRSAHRRSVVPTGARWHFSKTGTARSRSLRATQTIDNYNSHRYNSRLVSVETKILHLFRTRGILFVTIFFSSLSFNLIKRASYVMRHIRPCLNGE